MSSLFLGDIASAMDDCALAGRTAPTVRPVASAALSSGIRDDCVFSSPWALSPQSAFHKLFRARCRINLSTTEGTEDAEEFAVFRPV